MTTPATRYLSFTYFETMGVYRGADTLGQIGNFLTNTYLPLKDRVRLGNDGSETLDTHNYVLNYLEQGAFHFIVPFLVRGVFFPDYEFVAKTLFASCVASAIACTIIGIICLQMSTTQQDAFEAYIQKQWLGQPASSFISKSPKFIAQFLPTNKAHDVLKDVDSSKKTQLFEQAEKVDTRLNFTALVKGLPEDLKTDVATAILTAKFEDKQRALSEIVQSAPQTLMDEMISLAPLQSDQHVDLVNLAQVGCRSFPQRVVELRSDSVMRLLDQLEESFRWPIMVANIPHLPMTAQHEELSLTKVLEIAKQETDKKEAIYRAIATIREGQFVCPNVQACLQQMDSTERLLFFAAIPKDAADIAASMLSQDQITASIPNSSGRVASPQVGVLTLLAIIDKTHAQQAISAMPDSYVEALAAQLPLKNDRMIDLADLIKYAQNSKAAYRKVVNNRDKTEIDEVYNLIGEEAFAKLLRAAPLKPPTGKIGLQDIVDKIGIEQAALELERMLKEDSPPADHIMALLTILPIKNTIGLLEQLKGVSYFARMVNCLPACSDTHLSLCHLLSLDLSEDNRQKVLKAIAKRGKNAEVKALKKQMTDSFAYLLLYVEAKVSNGGLDFATVRKNVADPQEVYRALWTSNRKRFLQMVGSMPKEDAKHFPISEIKRQDYDDLVEMLQKEDTDHIDLKDCLQNLDQIEIAKAFLTKKKKSDTHTFLSLFNGALVALAEFIPMNDPSKIDAIEILTYHPEEAENFIRAYLDLHKNDPTNAYVYLLPFAPKSVFDTEIESLEDPNLVKVLKKLFTTHEKWYCLAYLVEKFPVRLIPLIVENLSIMTILNLQGHFFTHDQKKLANQIGLKLATTHKEESASDIAELGSGKTGIPNANGNDCFLISLCQAIMHTPFLEFFTNDRNLMNGNRRVFEEIQTFVEGYYKNAKKNVQAPNVKKLREAMSIGRTHLARGQQDVSEAFKALIDPYKINDTVAAKVKYHRWVELPNQTEGLKDADPIDRDKFSVVQRDGKLPNPPEEPLVPLHVTIPIDKQAMTEAKKGSDPIVFADAMHETVKKKKADDEFIVIYENKVVKTKIIKEQLEIAHLPDHLVIEVKRFMHQGENNHSNAAKLYNEIIVKEQEQIQGENYELTSFIIHHGSTAGGHYTACCKTNGEWFYYNDGATPVKKSTDQALELARDAYTLFFEKVKN